MMSYLKISVPPVRFPVVCSTVGSIVVGGMVMAIVVVMRGRVVMRGSSMKVVRGRVGTMSPMLGVGKGMNMLLNVFVLLDVLPNAMLMHV